ncbi:MAG: hypothetical protein WCM76_12610 [Bacteroidota bacterium]
MQRWRYFPTIIIFLLAFYSCKKEQDVSDPLIVISSPFDGQQFGVFDEIAVRGVVSDDRKLEYVTVVLEDLNMVPVLKSYTFYPDNSTFQVDLSYAVNDVHLPSGEYYLLIRASDGVNEKNEFVRIGITAVPKKLECIYLVESLTDKVLIQKVDTAGNVSTIMTKPPDYSASAISSDYRLLLLCGKYSEDLTAYDVTSLQPSWNVDVINSPPFPYFENMVYDDGKLFVAYRDGHWDYYNLSGAMLTSKVTDQNWMPENFLVKDEFLITYQHEISGVDNKLVVYFLSSTAARQDYPINLEVIKMFNQYADQYLVFGNFMGQAYVQLHDISNGYLYNPVSLPPGTITSVERLSDKEYAIAIGNNILVYDDDAATVNTLIPGVSASLVRFDSVNAKLYVVPQSGGGIVNMYAWPGGQYLGTINSEGTASEILFQYNRE